MNTEQRVRAALRDLVDAVPVAPPPPAAVRSRAQRYERGSGADRARVRGAGHRLAPVLAAAGLMLVVAAVAAVGLLPRWAISPEPSSLRGGGVAGPVLPDRFAGRTPGTASVEAAPPGPAIAVFDHATAGTVDIPVVVGVDGRTYREVGDVSRLTNAGDDPVLLAPDGSALAGGGGSFLDLTTGELTVRPVLPGDTLRDGWKPTVPLAWSPDGRWLAYGRIPVPEGDRTDLALLDLDTGEVTFVTTGRGDGPPRVAFSPDSSELAVSTGVADGGAAIRIFDLAGDLVRELSPPAGHLLAPNGTAWSPDGALLLVQDPQRPRRLAFVDASGTGAAVPGPVTVDQPYGVEPVGWRGPETLLLAAYREPGSASGVPRSLARLVEVPVAGGASRVVSVFPHGERDHVEDVRLASGLLPLAEIRDAGRLDHGPVPAEYWIPRVAGGAMALVAALLAGLLVRRWWAGRRAAP
ncbi:MAG TPA: hypothetical protein VKY81_06720 [Natronosporangium sp.]|nr:hypothetical protein [Natronosporangium sp.]